MMWLYRKMDNQNFRCFSNPYMNKSLKFEFLCRKFWFLSFEKGLEMPQDPIYSWFQDLRNIFQDVLCFCYVCFWSFLDWGIVETCTGEFCLEVCIRKYCFVLGLCKVIKHFLMESPTLWSFLIPLKWPVMALNFQNGWQFMNTLPQLCTISRCPIFVTDLYPYPVLVAAEETKYSAGGKGVQTAETLGFGLYNLILI